MTSRLIERYLLSPYSVQSITIRDGDDDIDVDYILNIGSLTTLIITQGGMQYFTFNDIKQICASHPKLEKIKFCVRCVSDFSEEKKKLIFMMKINEFINVGDFNAEFNP